MASVDAHTPSRRDTLSRIPTLDQILSSRPDRLTPRKHTQTLQFTPTSDVKRVSFLTSKPFKSGVRPSLLKSPAPWASTAVRSAGSESPSKAIKSCPNTESWREVGFLVEDSEECASELSGDSDPPSPEGILRPRAGSAGRASSAESDALPANSPETTETVDPVFSLLTFGRPSPKTPKTPSPKTSIGPVEQDDLFSPASAKPASRQLPAERETPLGGRARPIEMLSSDEEVSPSKELTNNSTEWSPDKRLTSVSSEENLDVNEGMLFFEPVRNPVRRKAKADSQAGPSRLLFGLPQTPTRLPSHALHREKRQAATEDSDEAEVIVLSSSDESSFSPVKPRAVPRTPFRTRPVTVQTPSTTPKRTPGKNKKSKQAALAHLAEETVVLLNSKVFENKIPHDLKLVWSKRLNTTAGRANWKRIRKECGEDEHQCSIDLSTKVLDTDERVLNTVAHELCHLAAWIIDGQIQPAHGRSFKAWAKKVMKCHPDIEITTRHDYEIAYRYEWRCANPVCARTYGRHTKSIDPTQHACGICKGQLEPMFQTCSPTKRNPFQDYLKTHMRDLKAKNPGMSHAELMKELSRRFKEEKALQNTAEIPEMDDDGLIEKMKAMRLG